MKNLITNFCAVSATIIATQAMADDEYYGSQRVIEIFDSYAAPHIDSHNNSFIDALNTLDDICSLSVGSKWLDSLCMEVGDTLDTTPHIGLDVSNPTEIFLNRHHNAADDISDKFRAIFNQYIENNLEKCPIDGQYQCFEIDRGKEKVIFAFPILIA